MSFKRTERKEPNTHMKSLFTTKKICRFCMNNVSFIDYKDIKMLRTLITERGKIIPRRISGNCAKHQRHLTTAVKRSRNIALMAFTVKIR